MKFFTWKQRIQVFTWTLATVAVFGTLGWWVGSAIDSSSGGLTVAVLLSYPVSLWIIVRKMGAGAIDENNKQVEPEATDL